MSNDLISRSAAGKLLRAYADEVGCNRGEYELANGILKAVTFLSDSKNIPTAYDVDKVVKNLKTHKDCYEMKATEYDESGNIENMDISDAIALAYGKAIEIVKAGGIDLESEYKTGKSDRV